mgnify:CR=1 FL=1
MSGSNRIPNGRSLGPSQTMQLPIAQVMIKGSRAQFHINRHALKLHRHRFDAGIDLYPAVAPITSEPLGNSWVRLWIHTFVHMVTPPGVLSILQGRSSTADKLGGAFVIPSIIDPGYAGELRIRVHCLKQDEDLTRRLIMQHINEEKALAQIVLTPYVFAGFSEWNQQLVDALGRGEAGYGSTDSIEGGKVIPPNN